ncbi:MAG: nucleoside hydrolase [Promethearchaeota archaeon]
MKEKEYRVIVDTDPGLGKIGADIDDGLAIFLMLNNPEIFHIEGISIVKGNTRINVGYKLAREYLKVKKREDIPVLKGASSKREFGKENDAVKFMIDLVKEHPKEITIIALGPLTNVSTAINLDSEFLDNIKRVVFMGGTLYPIDAFSEKFRFLQSNDYNKTEFNFYSDANAAKILLETPTKTPRIGFGLDVCCKVVFREEHFEQLKTFNTPVINHIMEPIRFWLNLWKFNKSNGFYPFDTLVPIYLIEAELFKFIKINVEIDTIHLPGQIFILEKNRFDSAPIKYCIDFNLKEDINRFLDILIKNLGR